MRIPPKSLREGARRVISRVVLMPIHLGRQQIKDNERRTPDTLPDVGLTPAFEPPPRGRRCAKFALQILPIASSDEDIENAIDAWSCGSRRRW